MAATFPITLATSGLAHALASLFVGMAGVWLARRVFVDRENRRIRRRQPLRETAPLTLIAMLIAGVIIVDRELGLSAAAFTGLGVGWTAVLLLDILGDKVIGLVRALGSVPPASPMPSQADMSGEDGRTTFADADLPPDMQESLAKLDRNDMERGN